MTVHKLDTFMQNEQNDTVNVTSTEVECDSVEVFDHCYSCRLPEGHDGMCREVLEGTFGYPDRRFRIVAEWERGRDE